MRKLIAGLKVSLDGKVAGPEGIAEWVDAWSEDYDLTPHIDACVLGGGMYPGYEAYWTAVQNAPDQPSPMTGKPPTPQELEWGRFASRTPHYVLSNTVTAAHWQKTSFLKRVEELAVLKHCLPTRRGRGPNSFRHIDASSRTPIAKHSAHARRPCLAALRSGLIGSMPMSDLLTVPPAPF